MKVTLTLVVIAVAGMTTGCGTRVASGRSSGPVTGMEFVTIPSGSFQMGSPSSELYRDDNEKQHLVILESFELMTTEVTQGMWEEVMGTTVDEMRQRSDFDAGLAGVGHDYPMYYVSWDDCQEFISRLNSMDSRYTYRLPTEAEWEYAARAGTTTRFYWGDDPEETQIGNYAWFSGNTGGYPDGSTQPVGTKLPNAWGLYDMSGNVWEWCEDVYTSNYDNCPANGSAYTGSGSYRVSRGGSWYGYARYCRSAYRFDFSPDYRLYNLGFRVARSEL